MLFDQAIDIPEILQSGALEVLLMGERLRYSIRINKAELSAIKKLSGLKFPTKIGKTDMSAAMSILCLGPDEWLIIAAPKEKTKLAKTLAKIEKNFTVSITDISHRNVGFRIVGANAIKTVNVGCPLDLSLEAFPVRKTARTIFESASIILTRTGETEFDIECWRSFAPYLQNFFARIANDKRV